MREVSLSARERFLKGHMSSQQLVNKTKNFGVDFDCSVTFYFS